MSADGTFAADYCCSDVESDDSSQKSVADGGSFISDGSDDVSTISLCNNLHEDTTYKIVDKLPNSGASNLPQVLPEISLENDVHAGKINDNMNGGENEEQEGAVTSSGTPQGKSIAHKHLEAGEVAFLSFDVETGGELCGIVQISCQIFCFALPASSTSSSQTITTNEDLFNKYVRPQEGAIWSQYAINVHGITPSDPRIQGADTIEDVWRYFCEFVDQRVRDNEVAIFVA